MGQPPRPAGEAPPRSRRIDRAWLVIGAVLLGALGVMLLGALMVPHRQDDMWVNIVSRSAQLVVFALAGGVVGAVIHDRDAAREATRRRDAFLGDFLDEVEAAFGQVKTSRRLLRTFGFAAPRDTPLSPEQASGFRTQMALLNDAELHFESLARKAAALPVPFGDAAAEVAGQLACIHAYLNAVLREWEADPTAVAVGGVTADHGAWPRFDGFVGFDDSGAHAFKAEVADRVLAIEVAIQATSDMAEGGR